jgi:CubicO group peptidase (beta-lactamase class C family)
MTDLDALLAGHLEAWPTERAAMAVTTPEALIGQAGDPDETYPLASVTKPLTALAVLLAVEEQTISLDDPLGPEGATVAHLLAHTSGLGPDSPTDRLANPGAKRIYSNAGYDLLAEHVALRADMAFGDYARLGVFEPLGLDHTTIDGSAAKDGRGSVDDLTRICREIMVPTLLAPTTVAMATTTAFPGLAGVVPGYGRQTPADWGLGFEIRGTKTPHWTGTTNSPATFGHFGRSGTFFWVDPTIDLALVAFSDREFDQWAIAGWPRLADDVVATYA